jgi:DNA-directed RNA polymerase subunit RPC12/RpoP
MDLEPRSKTPAGKPLRSNPDDLVFSCPDCGETIVVTSDASEQKVTCPSCTAEIDLQLLDEEAPGGGPDASPTAAADEGGEEEFVTFVCQTCGQEIEAPIDLVGLEADCPACGSHLSIGAEGGQAPTPPEGTDSEGPDAQQMSSMTIRIDLSDLS